MSWGHATSDDLANWTEVEPALLADELEMVFSGSAVIDRTNSSGFGHDAMIALYTAARREPVPNQAQALAQSSDRGTTWTRYAGNPVLDLAMADFRDPYVFRHEASDSWVMVVVKSNEQVAQIYRSADLLHWALASEINAGAAPGKVWECPTLIELPICGRETSRWLFKVDALHDAPGAGALYITGHFDGYRFTQADDWQVVDAGRDFYAAIAWNGPRDNAGRPAWIGWMGNHAYQHQFPKRGWRGVMSVPRRMGLVERDGGLKLAQHVEPSVAGLFRDFAPIAANPVVPLSSWIELAGDFSGSLDLTDGAGSRFGVRTADGGWSFTREDEALPFLSCESFLERRDGEGLALLIDSETIEAFTTSGTGCASFQHRPEGGRLSLETDQPKRLTVAALA